MRDSEASASYVSLNDSLTFWRSTDVSVSGRNVTSTATDDPGTGTHAPAGVPCMSTVTNWLTATLLSEVESSTVWPEATGVEG